MRARVFDAAYGLLLTALTIIAIGQAYRDGGLRSVLVTLFCLVAGFTFAVIAKPTYFRRRTLYLTVQR